MQHGLYQRKAAVSLGAVADAVRIAQRGCGFRTRTGADPADAIEVQSPQPAVDADPDRLVGRDLPPFRITGVLGRGAMGRVYSGEHVILGRPVAIKVLEPRFARDPDCAARFVEEARAVGRIHHPNIVDITDYGEVDGRPYYVMELLGGETLAARIGRERGLPAAAAVAIAIEVAGALAAAHDHGVVHRDLKPDNIFLCAHPDARDRVKVLDFGVAKVLRRDGDGSDGEPASVDTRAGRLMGTPLYMSPEQCLGQPVDPRSDVYALGVVLFECLTGKAPFVRESWLEVLLAHVSDPPPPPSSLGRPVSPALEAIVLRALAKDPGERWSDMRELRTALASSASEPARSATIAAMSPAELATASAAAGAAVAGAGASGVASSAARPGTLASAGGGRATVGREPRACGVELAEVLRQIIVARLDSGRLVLPAMPASVAAALAELRSRNVDLAQVARTLGADPLVAPQVLALACTAVFAAHGPPPTVLRAVLALGLDRVRTALVAMSARRLFESPRAGVRTAFAGMWAHSQAVAELARAVGRQLGAPVDPEGVHLGGLLHDVGKPVVGAILLEAEKLIGPRFVVDRGTWIDVVARSHREIAIALAKAWQLDPTLCAVIAGCDRYGGGVTADVVCLANAIAKRAGRTVGPVDQDAADDLIAEGAERLGVDWKFVHALRMQLSAPA